MTVKLLWKYDQKLVNYNYPFIIWQEYLKSCFSNNYAMENSQKSDKPHPLEYFFGEMLTLPVHTNCYTDKIEISKMYDKLLHRIG